MPVSQRGVPRFFEATAALLQSLSSNAVISALYAHIIITILLFQKLLNEFVDNKQNEKFVFIFRSILYCLHYLICHCSSLIILQQFICLPHTLHFCSSKHYGRPLQWRSSNHDCFLYKLLHTRQTEFLLRVVCFVLSFYSPTV